MGVNPVIIVEQIRIYKKYIGDIDAWARVGTRHEHEIMADSDWGTISEIVQGLGLIKSGYASAGFAEKLREKMKTVSGNNPKAMRELYQLGSDDMLNRKIKEAYQSSGNNEESGRV